MTTFTETSTASAAAGGGSTLSHATDEQVRAAVRTVRAQQRAAAEAAARTMTLDQAFRAVTDANGRYEAAAKGVRDVELRDSDAVEKAVDRRDEAMRLLGRAYRVLEVLRQRESVAHAPPDPVKAGEPADAR